MPLLYLDSLQTQNLVKISFANSTSINDAIKASCILLNIKEEEQEQFFIQNPESKIIITNFNELCTFN